MSNTYKDKPWELTEYYKDWQYELGRTTKQPRKKRRNYNSRWCVCYNRAPSWWTRMFMNRPARRKAHLLERKALISDLEQFHFYVVEDYNFEYYY